jgi:hypothetical protein
MARSAIAAFHAGDLERMFAHYAGHLVRLEHPHEEPCVMIVAMLRAAAR